MQENLDRIFKAYDVRGIYPSELDEKTASRIGQAYAAINKPRRVAVGRDVRSTGAKLKDKLISSLLDSGVDVLDIGVITTDQLYFAVGNYDYDGGISVTASHNPGEYNGFKFAEKGGAPISSEALVAVRDWAMSDKKIVSGKKGQQDSGEILNDYIDHLLSYIDVSSIKPLRIVANANFGAVGRGLDKIADRLNLKLERLNWKEDGSFPKGPPNPLLPSNRDETIEKIKLVRPDLGVAWDADADRCFFFTDEGAFIPSCFIIALLSQEFLHKYPGSKIVHDITTSWVIDDTVKAAGGKPITNRTGHTFIKTRMREENAPFAGESSGHYYFRDSFFADNGLVPFLMILQMVSTSGKNLAELVKPLMDKYKVSDEMNFTVKDPQKEIERIEEKFAKSGRVEKMDGLAIDSGKWRFSVRPSNTEPLFRLNAEAHDQAVLDKLVKEISLVISRP